MVRPVKKQVCAGEHRHGSCNEQPGFQGACGPARKDDACGDCARPGKKRDCKGRYGDVLLFTGKPGLPCGDLGAGGAAVEEFQGDDEGGI